MATRSNLTLIDILGGLIVLACAAGFVWLAFLREDSVTSEISTRSSAVAALRKDLAGSRGALEAQREELSQRRLQLQAQGNLPERGPVDRDLRTLADLARRHGIELLRMVELPARQYPGLQELRYTLEANGGMPDLMRFLQAIEDADLWADVGYVQVDGGTPVAGMGTGRRSTRLTVSLFAAAEAEPAPAAPAKKKSG
ncbi:MAG TPA: hypothetical protein PKK06_10995 [Phycisphaerae bacterium]|nr:hypothetical protein [Phycisphaerae bacterium]HNU44342.1 hypothetical protein [Phycisphaerae bacterium]